MASSLNASTSGGGGVITTADSSGNLNIQSGGSTVVAVTSAGATVTGTLSATGASTFTGTGKFATTIGVGNATPAASGSGITFPASQSASSDANTLDDYEEGTWTPVPSRFVGGAITTTGSITATGGYTKVGNLVTIVGSIIITGTVTQGSSDTVITGLPFTPNVSFGGAFPCSFAYVSALTSNLTDASGLTVNAQYGLTTQTANVWKAGALNFICSYPVS